jgi:hypothetical protein
MKRKSSYHRRITLRTPFVRPTADRESNLARTFSTIKQPGSPVRKIFVIKQARRLEPRNGAEKTVRRILIFDNHPDSLRLVYEGGVDSLSDPFEPLHVSGWGLILVSVLTSAALIGMF